LKVQPFTIIKKYLKWSFGIVLILIIGSLIMGFRWATYARPPLHEAIGALESDDNALPITTLTSAFDQAALLSLLRRLYSLGLPLISVICVEIM